MAKKILVIDDSALMRRVISDIINESNEYEVAAIAKDGLCLLYTSDAADDLLAV